MENQYEDYSPQKAMRYIVTDETFKISRSDIGKLTKIICKDNCVLEKFLSRDYLSGFNQEKIITIIENIPDDKVYLLLKNLSDPETGYGNITYKLLKRSIYKIKEEKRKIVESVMILIELEKSI